MSEFKGTKGIWEKVFQDRFNIGVFADGKALISVKIEDDLIQEAEANAKLITCAPLMLEMLKQNQTLIDRLSSANLITPEFMNECYNILSENQKLINKST